MAYLKGIDVSNWQGVINWSAVRASGVEYALIKISEGTYYYDPTASRNYSEGKANGIAMGGYHFAAGEDPVAEANKFVDGMSPIEKYDVFVLDWEIEVSNPVGWCEKFVQHVYNRTGVWCLMYMNGSTRNKYNWTDGILKNCGFWIAWYGRDPEGDLPVNGSYIMHQYTSDGIVNGINGRVDMNAFYGTIDQFKSYGYSPKPEPTPASQPAPAPTPEPVPQPAPDPTPAPVQEPDDTDYTEEDRTRDKETNSLIKWIVDLLKKIFRV